MVYGIALLLELTGGRSAAYKRLAGYSCLFSKTIHPRILVTELGNYFGVSCFRCGEPILVSARVRLQQEIAEQEVNAAHVSAFPARCGLCEYETVYPIRRVQRFGGQPRGRIGRARRSE
jgi:hypothetical protein